MHYDTTEQRFDVTVEGAMLEVEMFIEGSRLFTAAVGVVVVRTLIPQNSQANDDFDPWAVMRVMAHLDGVVRRKHAYLGRIATRAPPADTGMDSLLDAKSPPMATLT